MQRTRVLQIASKALQLRQKYLNLGASVPICPYTLADAMGLELRFIKIPSFEGMYVQNDGLILISAERPEGRKRFTCAHELGHHVLGHGTVIDEIVKSGSDLEQEKEADCFAGMLLIPQLALQHCLSEYGKTVTTLTPSDAYVLSNYFGVSYEGFLTHLRYSLHALPELSFKQLKNKALKSVRTQLLGQPTENQVIVIGPWWESRAIEIEEGDYIVSGARFSIDGPGILDMTGDKPFAARAIGPGIARIYTADGWSAFVKISRSKFVGMFQYKYEKEEEDEH